MRGVLNEWLQNPESRRVVLQRTWQRSVGDVVGKHCRAIDFNDGVLKVEVTDPEWKPQLVEMSAELLYKVNAALGKSWVQRIEWI